MSPSPCLTSTARRAARAVLVALGLTVVVLAGATGAGGAPAQVPTSSTPGPATTTQNLLSSSTTAPSTTSAAQQSTSTTSGSNSSASDDAADDNRRVWYVVAALVAVALALTGLTIWYWFRTRPTAAGRRAVGTSPGRHGRAGAPLDHDLPPVDTTEAPVDAGTDREQTPARGTAAVASVPADLRAATLTGRARARAERRPLTTDDAPDHDASDQDWAPRGTGEHDRVDVDRPVTRRPDRSARAAALERARDSP